MYGLEIFDGNGVRVLDMTSFTIRKIYETTLPQYVSNWTNGVRTDSIVIDVPGFSPWGCFVSITPSSYSGAQSQSSDPLLTPYYRELGGSLIGIVVYQQDSWWDNSNQRRVNRWRERSVACTIEVFKVIGI